MTVELDLSKLVMPSSGSAWPNSTTHRFPPSTFGPRIHVHSSGGRAAAIKCRLFIPTRIKFWKAPRRTQTSQGSCDKSSYGCETSNRHPSRGPLGTQCLPCLHSGGSLLGPRCPNNQRHSLLIVIAPALPSVKVSTLKGLANAPHAIQ
jgi:hypothetical protein